MSDIDRARLILEQEQVKAKRSAAVSAMQGRNKLAIEQSTGQPLPDRTQAIADADAIAERDMARASISRPRAAAHSFNQGQTLGFGDEAIGAVLGEDKKEQFRDEAELARTAYPNQSLALEIGGSIASPASLVAPQTTSLKGAAAVAGSIGAVDAMGRAEGGLTDRIDDAARGAATGFIGGGLTGALTKGASKGLQAIFNRAESRPTLEALKAAKNAAYRQVRKAGVQFTPDDMQAAFNRISRKSKTSRWDLDPLSDVDKGAFSALRILERRANSGKPVTLNNLDKTRQKLWDIYRRDDNPFILEAISEIDDVIASKASGNDLMKTARAANSTFSKAQLLENAFRKAQLETAGSGSGGNILNKYRQAVTRIITKPQEAKWFSAEELAVMESFVVGDVAENTLRRVGKLAPGGNGLMTALNVYAASVDPSMLAITGAASAAKGLADRSAMKGSEDLLDAVSTGVIKGPAKAVNLTPAGIVAGATAGKF